MSFTPLQNTFQNKGFSVKCLAYRSDGKLLASGGSSRDIDLWNPLSLSCGATLRGQNKSVYCVSFSPDGTQLASAGSEKIIELWNLEFKKTQVVLQGHEDPIKAVAYAPKAVQLASAGAIIKLWDLRTQKCQLDLTEHKKNVRALVYSPLTDILASGSEDCSVKLWDLQTTQTATTFKESRRIESVAISPEGGLLVSGSSVIKLWDPRSKDCIATLRELKGKVFALTFLGNKHELASGCDNHVIGIWDLRTRTCLATLQGHKDSVLSIAYSHPDQLASGSSDKTIKLWDLSQRCTKATVKETSLAQPAGNLRNDDGFFSPSDSGPDEVKMAQLIPQVDSSKSKLSVEPSVLRSPIDVDALFRRKLDNPTEILNVEESISLLAECIRRGDLEAQKGKGKNLVVLIGNTGAGKSTFANALCGCTMERVRPRDVGVTGLNKLVVVKPVSEGGQREEIMPIGHTRKSTTFMPQLVELENEMTLCDCPGFLDNRGHEINIANAANIRNALIKAKSVKVVILINYHSLLADKARGLADMIKICCDLFGSKENLIAHKESILLGVTQIPTAQEDEIEDLADLQDFIADKTLQDEFQRATLGELAKRLFIYDPLDVSQLRYKGMLSKKEALTKIVDLEPIQEPKAIFKTVLNAFDIAGLINISDEIQKRIQSQLDKDNLSEADYKKVSEDLDTLKKLEIIEHTYILKLISKSKEVILQHFYLLVQRFNVCCAEDSTRFANEALDILTLLKTGVQYFSSDIQDKVKINSLEERYEALLKKGAAKVAVQKLVDLEATFRAFCYNNNFELAHVILGQIREGLSLFEIEHGLTGVLPNVKILELETLIKQSQTRYDEEQLRIEKLKKELEEQAERAKRAEEAKRKAELEAQEEKRRVAEAEARRAREEAQRARAEAEAAKRAQEAEIAAIEARPNFFEELIRSGNLERIKLHYNNGFSLRSYSANGLTPLINALFHEKWEIADWLVITDRSLLRFECFSNNGSGHTPMTWAAAQGKIGAMQWLKRKGVSPDEETSNKNTYPIIEAICTNQVGSLAWLHNNGVSLKQPLRNGRSLLMYALANNKMEAAEWLVGKEPSLLTQKAASEPCVSPIFFAVDQCGVRQVEWLYNKGLSLKEIYNGTSTLLSYALWTEKWDTAEWLVSKDSSLLRQETSVGHTPMTGLTGYGRIPAMQWLMRKGVNLRETSSKGVVVYRVAQANNQHVVLSWLATQGVYN